MSIAVFKRNNASGLKRSFTAPVSVGEGHAKVPFFSRGPFHGRFRSLRARYRRGAR
jgi:hypothetical protein